MTEQQLLDLVQQFAHAELHGDVAAFQSLLTPDFAGIGPVGFTLDKEQWTGRHRGDLTNHEFEIADVRVRMYGTAAIVNGVQRQRTSVGGRDVGGSFRITLVAVAADGGWAIANIQLSGPLQAPPDPTISRTELRAGIEAGAVIVVDALPAAAYRRRHLPTALNLTAEEAPDKADALLPDRSAPIVVYSTDTACTRAPELVAALGRLGYRNVRRYADGIEDWASAGLPIEPARQA